MVLKNKMKLVGMSVALKDVAIGCNFLGCSIGKFGNKKQGNKFHLTIVIYM